MNLARNVLLILAAMIATPAAAQDDWDLGRDPGRRLTAASVNFDDFGVSVRCVDDVSIWPAATAAYLSRGGRWVLEVPAGERIRRISVDLPASPSAIGEVFGACGRTLTPTSELDEPDREKFGILRWIRRPEVSFPSRGGLEAQTETRAESGLVALTCTVTAQGALRGCRVESEFPEGAGLGRAAVIRVHRDARVGPEDPDSTVSMEGQRVSWVLRINMGPDIPLPADTPSGGNPLAQRR